MKKIVYLFDNINYQSGAQKITLYQIEQLIKYYEIGIFSLTRPRKDIIERFPNVKFLNVDIWNNAVMLEYSLFNILLSKNFGIKQKLNRLKFSFWNYFHQEEKAFKKIFSGQILSILESYDTVIVVSEASRLRTFVCNLKKPKKIQWIHTDYYHWSNFSNWTKNVTKNDKSIYSKFDYIVTLSNCSRKGFLEIMPQFENKVKVIPNLVPYNEIILMSKEKENLTFSTDTTNIVTIGRIDKEKNILRIVEVCNRLKKDNLNFQWYIIGDGPLYEEVYELIKKEKLMDTVQLLGKIENPYPILKQADIFALLSSYEGLPLSIYEALVLGVPVVATKVGGIEEQLNFGQYGVLVDDDEEDIYSNFYGLLLNEEKLKRLKKVVLNFNYDNTSIINNLIRLF